MPMPYNYAIWLRVPISQNRRNQIPAHCKILAESFSAITFLTLSRLDIWMLSTDNLNLLSSGFRDVMRKALLNVASYFNREQLISVDN